MEIIKLNLLDTIPINDISPGYIILYYFWMITPIWEFSWRECRRYFDWPYPYNVTLGFTKVPYKRSLFWLLKINYFQRLFPNIILMKSIKTFGYWFSIQKYSEMLKIFFSLEFHILCSNICLAKYMVYFNTFRWDFFSTSWVVRRCGCPWNYTKIYGKRSSA